MTLVLASGNAGKVREFKRILEPMGVTVLSTGDLGLHVDVEETGATFEENARIKAEAVMRLCGHPTIADDSGICVDALDGAPGVYSARYGGPGATDDQKIDKLLDALREVPLEKRTARFEAAICCCFPDGDELTAHGTCEGWVGYEKRGDHGFGYDPIFYTADGTFSEISDEKKDEISHRGRALRAFAQRLQSYRSAQNRTQSIE